MNWYWCDLKYACFGFATKEDIVIVAPPIFKWATGRNIKSLKSFFNSRNAKVLEI